MSDICIKNVAHKINIRTPKGFNLEFNGPVVNLKANLSNYYTKEQTDQLLGTKQDTLTFDDTPTQGSTNPVTSAGIYNVIGDIESLLSEV